MYPIYMSFDIRQVPDMFYISEEYYDRHVGRNAFVEAQWYFV